MLAACERGWHAIGTDQANDRIHTHNGSIWLRFTRNSIYLKLYTQRAHQHKMLKLGVRVRLMLALLFDMATIVCSCIAIVYYSNSRPCAKSGAHRLAYIQYPTLQLYVVCILHGTSTDTTHSNCLSPIAFSSNAKNDSRLIRVPCTSLSARLWVLK